MRRVDCLRRTRPHKFCKVVRGEYSTGFYFWRWMMWVTVR